MSSYEDGEIWNEYQWEVHLNEMEQKSERLRLFIEKNLGEDSPRWTRFLDNFSSSLEAIDAYIEDELMFEDAYFPDDDDDWDDEDDDDMEDFFMSVDDADADDDELDEGDLWKKSLPESERERYSSGSDNENETWFRIEDITGEDDGDEADEEYMSIYDEARELAAGMLKLAELVPEQEKDQYFMELISETVNLGARVAGAFAFGFDSDVLGGNIAYCKRALKSVNRVLEMLPGLRAREFMKLVDYRSLHERMFDLRNDIGMHIQDMREALREAIENEDEDDLDFGDSPAGE
jgi:hypothetical protein